MYLEDEEREIVKYGLEQKENVKLRDIQTRIKKEKREMGQRKKSG